MSYIRNSNGDLVYNGNEYVPITPLLNAFVSTLSDGTNSFPIKSIAQKNLKDGSAIYDWVGTSEEYNNATPVYCWSAGSVLKVYTTTETPTTSDKCYMVKTLPFTIDSVGTNTIVSGGWTYTRDSTQDTYWDVAFEHPDWVCFITDDIGGSATEIGQITEALNGKADVSTVAHVVTEFQAPTSANNYTWYRKYADGWVEQGGIYTFSSSSPHTITLPQQMSSVNYDINISAGYPGVGDNTVTIHIRTDMITTTSFAIQKHWTSNNGAYYWQVSGMAA